MEGKCIVKSCSGAASKCCGSCGWARYCSIKCQKEDWKAGHKMKQCINIKTLILVPLSEKEIDLVATKMTTSFFRLEAAGELSRGVTLLKECLEFTRNRLDQLHNNDSHSSNKNGKQHINMTTIKLLLQLSFVHRDMSPSSESEDYALSYSLEAREMMVRRKDSGINDIWTLLSSCDQHIYFIYNRKGDPEKAKYHILECVASARRITDPDQAEALCPALTMYSMLLQREGKVREALATAEEAYIFASKTHNPAHKLVLKTSYQVIECLIKLKDYSTADGYCRMMYENVNSSTISEEYHIEDTADVMFLLVRIWLAKKPDEDEIAEKALTEEAVELSRKAYAHLLKVRNVKMIPSLLETHCHVLVRGNQLDEETERLVHQLVVHSIQLNKSLDSILCLGKYYYMLLNTFPVGEKDPLVQANFDLCNKKFKELDRFPEGYFNWVKGTEEIKPYFKNNVAFCI